MKKKICYRVISAFLAVMMIFTILPLNIFAMGSDNENAGTNTSSPNGTTDSGEEITLSVEPTVNTLTYDKWDGVTVATSLGGNGTAESPYTITNGAELMYFAAQVNGGNSYEGKHVHLKANIDMDMFTNGKTWTPIGVLSSTPFMGIFDGECHEIINLNITYDSTNAADGMVYYVGFFGYIKDATIEDFGIYDYKLNQTYNYDTEIGAMVAHTENSNITNCYAKGNISAMFEDSNPLDRDDVVTITSVPSELDYKNKHGQGIIIDLTNHPSNVNKTMTIKGDVSAIRIIGKEGITYTDFNIIISDHEHFSIYIDYQNTKIAGSSTKGTLLCDNGRTMHISFNGNKCELYGANGAPAINAVKSTVTISGEASVTVRGGNGTDGAQSISKNSNGVKGKDGSEAICCNVLNIQAQNSIGVFGGNGGVGGKGYDGKDGEDGDDGCGAWDTGSDGADGTDGEAGTNGGDGGDGASAAKVSYLNVISGNCHFTAGKGGAGGAGGAGGDGGDGGDGGICEIYKWIIDGSRMKGINAGDGAAGGDGGDGGNSGISPSTVLRSIQSVNVYQHDAISLHTQSSALAGEGGVAGKNGTGGAAGYRRGMKLFGGWDWKDYGSDGASSTTTPRDGDKGKILAASSSSDVEAKVLKSQYIPVTKLNCASINMGGFAGTVRGTSFISRCAATANNVTETMGFVVNKIYDYNTVAGGNFVAVNDGLLESGNIISVISAYIKDDVLQKYSVDTWFADHVDNRAEFAVSVLNNYTDSIGLVYDNAITSENTVSQSCSVVNKVGEKCAVIIPDYVFSGRFITAVTSIADLAFEGNNLITTVMCGANIQTIGDYAFKDSSITQITTGDTVREIGEEAFAACLSLKTAVLGENVSKIGCDLFSKSHALESITIGKSLVNIPDIANGKVPFGIDKSSSSLKEYVVSDGNTAYRTVDGILYELFEVKNTNGGESTFVTVAVIDTPVWVQVKNYAPLNHVVKIYANAFSYNKTIETVKLDYIREVGDKAFFGATNLRTVEFGTPEVLDSEYITILDEEIKAGRVEYSQIIGVNAFQDCISLESVNLKSEYITKIGSGAFRNCATSEGVEPLEITLGKNITSISANYDELYNNIENSTSDNSVKNFFEVFERSKIKSFNVVDGNEHYTAIDGVLYLRTGTMSEGKEKIWLIAYPKNKEAIVDAQGQDIAFKIPVLDDMVVTRIAKSSFSSVENLRYLHVNNGVVTVDNEAFTNAMIYSITFGDSVQHIGTTPVGTQEIFNGCSNLSSIYVDINNATYSDLNGVLYNKEQTELIKYPQAMSGYEFTAPSSVKEIVGNAFSGNNLIRRVTFASQIDDVGDKAFYGCSNLSIVYFKVGEAPFNSKTEVRRSGAFETNNPRTIVCYGEDTASWTNINDEYLNNENVKIFSIEKFAGYPTDKITTGYYAVVVVDKSGAPVNDIHVTIGETVKTQDGIAMFYNLEYNTPHELRVVDNLGVFFPIENATFYLDEETRITYITLSSVPTVSGINVSYDVKSARKIKKLLTDEAAAAIVGDGHKVVDINSETAQINTWCIDEIALLINCGMDIDTEIVGYRLVQNGKELKMVTDPNFLSQALTYKSENGKKFAKLNFVVETSRFEKEKDVYIIVDLSDGSQVQTKLNLHIFELDFYKIDMPFFNNNDALTLSISPELMNVLKGFGTEISFKLPKKHKIAVDSEADKFKVAVAYGDDVIDGLGFSEVNENNLGEFFKNWDTYCDSLKKGGRLYDERKLPYELENGFDIKFNLCGYIEIKYKGLDENGEPDIALESGVTGTVKFVYQFAHTVKLVVVPVRVEAEMSLSGSMTYKLVWDKEAESLCTGNIGLKLKGYLELSAGVGCALASAGVYGSAETVLVIDISPEFRVKKWTLEGDVGLYVKYNGLFVKWKKTWSILKGLGIDAKWVIYENGKWWYEADGQVASISELSLASAVYDESAYEIEASSFDPEVMTFSLGGIQAKQENAYDGIDPKMIQVGDLVYIIYQNDLNGYSDNYDAYNYQKIVYQTYNTATGEFSDVFVLDDNGYADGSYEVYCNGIDAVIVYSQLNKKLTTDNIDDMAGYVGALEVKTAVLSNGVFEASAKTLTSDEYYDMNLRVGKVDGKITAVWVRNAENTMFGTTENNNMSIWFSTYDGEAWSEPTCLKSNINTITDIEVGENGVAYITDSNNDLTTIGADKITEGYSDRLITVLDMDGNVTLLTAEEAAYHDVSYFGDEIVYYMGNNLYSIDTNAAYFDAAIAELTEDYTVLTDTEGNVKAILFVNTVIYNEETGADGSNVFAIFCDGDKWGSPIQLTDFGEKVFVSAFDAIDFENEMLISVLLSEVEYSEKSIDEYDNYTTTNRFETLWFEYPTDYVMDEVTFDYESISPNGETTLTIQITNNGYKSINEVPVSIVRNGSVIVSETASQFYNAEGVILTGGLLSGTSGYIKVTSNVGEANNELLYTVNVNGQTQDIQLWYSDFAVFGKQILIGDAYYIVTRVTNNGYVSASYQLTAWLGDEEIDSTVTDVLGYGETQYFTIPLEHTLTGDSSDLVFVKLNADNEYVLSNNESKINIAVDEILTISTESLGVWMSKTTAMIDRSNLENIEIAFDEHYTLVSAMVNDAVITEMYSVNNNAITLNANAFAAKYANGMYTVRLQFSDGACDEEGNVVYKYATLALTVTQTFTATWIVDGVSSEETYEIGAIPSAVNPTKKADAQYAYSFIGWDSNNDGVADEITAIQKNTTYVAIFSNTVKSYEVVWVVNGVQSEPQTYTYGSMPTYSGNPAKPSDAQYDYVFVGWDSEISAVTKDTTYTAVFEAVIRKYDVTTIVDGVSSTQKVEYGSMPVLTTPSKESDAQYHYSFIGWTPEVSTVYGNQAYTAQFSLTLRQYTITWVIDGVEAETTYDYGSMPIYNGTPSKQPNSQYSYSFTGWDKKITTVNGDAKYTAQFSEIKKYYTVSFIVNGTTHSETYEYGATPSYRGETSKPNDETYRYVFSGWDKEIVAVNEDTTYVAQYTAVLIGSATVSNTTFKTAWNCEFTTTVSLDNVQNMSSTVFTIYYNALLVELKSSDCCEGAKIIAEDEGYITVEVDGLSNAERNNVISLTFVTSDYAPIGESKFIEIVSEDKLTSNVGKLTIYQMGDVNMDGRVNTVDAAMIQRYAVKKLELDDIQKVYANVNGDLNADGSPKVNTIDAAMVQRFAVKKINELGNRITINFVDGEEIVSLTLVKGNELNYEPADGYAWSLAADQFISVDFTTLTSDTTVYMIEQ